VKILLVTLGSCTRTYYTLLTPVLHPMAPLLHPAALLPPP
jgi:hypothetical protein